MPHNHCVSLSQQSFHQEVTPLDLEDLAREHKFVQRNSNRIPVSDFVFLMSIDFVSNPCASLVELCRRLFELNSQSQLTPQSLSERINSSPCVCFFEAVFTMLLQRNRTRLKSTIPSTLLDPFVRILVEDSTQIQLHPQLVKPFAGSGGSASAAALKLDLIEDLKSGTLESIELYEGKKPDQSLTHRILESLRPQDLVLRDLGYFKVSIFAQIIKKQAFFLSRLLLSVSLFDAETQEPLDLGATLSKKNTRTLNVMDLNIRMGAQDQLPVRLVAYRLPQSVVNRRKRQAKANAKKKGYTPSKKHLKLLEFALYITNVEESVWPAEKIGTIYRLRWQIELTFKRWKSLLHIDFCKGTNTNRILVLTYARLIAIVLINDFQSCAELYAREVHQRELSPHKIVQWLIQKQRMVQALKKQALAELWNQFTLMVCSFCKQKRKRMTSWEMIQNEIDFLDSFQENQTISNQSQSSWKKSSFLVQVWTRLD